MPYQSLIDLCLRDCALNHKKLKYKRAWWRAEHGFHHLPRPSPYRWMRSSCFVDTPPEPLSIEVVASATTRCMSTGSGLDMNRLH